MVLMTTMTVTSMTTTPTMTVKMTVVVFGSEVGGSRDLSVAIAPSSEHESLESPRLHSLDMIQHDILILEQHKNLVVIRHGDPFRKTGRLP